MQMITIDELKTLLVRSPGWSVSLFMPAYRRGGETEQNAIRFRNLLRKAEEGLLAKGLRAVEAREMLAPAQRLLPQPDFWQHQSDGLALFLSAESFHAYRLPLPFEELVVISSRFHLAPLLPLFASDGHFYILALSQNKIRLMEGTRHTVDELDAGNTLPGMDEALQYERIEKQQQFHAGAAGGKRSAIFHGHDIGDEDKNKILRWFRKINEALPAALTGAPSPLVLAGVEYLFPLYREANTYPDLLAEGIPGNPDELKPEELHARAWPLVEPVFSKAREKAAAQYERLAGTGQTTTDLQEALLAANHGRVAVLFVAAGVQVWGTFDQAANEVCVHEAAEPDDEDLLDRAAIQTILNGGTVYAVEPEQVPERASLAAVFRY